MRFSVLLRDLARSHNCRRSRGRRNGTAKRETVARIYLLKYMQTTIQIRHPTTPLSTRPGANHKTTQRHPPLRVIHWLPCWRFVTPWLHASRIKQCARAFGRTSATARASVARLAPNCADPCVAMFTWAAPFPVCLATRVPLWMAHKKHTERKRVQTTPLTLNTQIACFVTFSLNPVAPLVSRSFFSFFLLFPCFSFLFKNFFHVFRCHAI